MKRNEMQNAAMESANHEAALWLARTDRGLKQSEEEALLEWLSSDPRHSDAFEKQKRNWKRLNALKEWRPEHSTSPNPDLLAPETKPEGRIGWREAGLAAAVAACFAVIVFWPVDPREADTPLDGVELTDEVRGPRVLSDGSRIFEKDQSEITVRFTETARLILLHSGEVYFDVAKDADRPFVVEARGIRLEAVGTAFNVRLSASSLELLIEEGTVALKEAGSPENRHASTDSKETSSITERYLGAHQRAIVRFSGSGAAPQVDSLSSSEVKRIMAWQHRKLYFQSRPLNQILAEFNRLNDTQLMLEDPALAHIQISGTMHSGNIDGFVRLLEAGFGIHSRSGDAETIILYDPSRKSL